MTGKKLLIVCSLTVAVGALAIFVAGSIAATEAMRPPRGSVAEVCPCISHVACRDVQSADQRGWYFVPDQPNSAAILMLHGIGATREDMIPLSAVFLRHGYAILAPDLRGSGQSGGLVTFGAREAKDTAAWAEWMRRQPGITRIYGFGVSLGGSSLLESLAFEDHFSAVIAESSFSDFPAVAEERIRRLIPTGLKWTAVPFVYSGLLWARVRFGEDLFTPSAVESIRKSRTPALIIHGLQDGKTLPEHSRQIAAANPRTTQLWLIPDAAHANAWATAGKVFEDRVLNWYATH